jgi:hypothetical protein
MQGKYAWLNIFLPHQSAYKEISPSKKSGRPFPIPLEGIPPEKGANAVFSPLLRKKTNAQLTIIFQRIVVEYH